jgi:hypothetical protein
MKAAQILIGPFVTYGLLKNFNRCCKRKETLGSNLKNIPLGDGYVCMSQTNGKPSHTIFS